MFQSHGLLIHSHLFLLLGRAMGLTQVSDVLYSQLISLKVAPECHQRVQLKTFSVSLAHRTGGPPAFPITTQTLAPREQCQGTKEAESPLLLALGMKWPCSPQHVPRSLPITLSIDLVM